VSIWQPGARPEWVRALHQISRPEWIELDAEAIAEEAQATTGLGDFESDLFWLPERFTGETCASLLDGMTALRASGRIPAERCMDARYGDLVENPGETLVSPFAITVMDFR
jgi:hypothetical protein